MQVKILAFLFILIINISNITFYIIYYTIMEKMKKKSSKETENIYEILHTIGKKWSLELLEITKKTSKSYTELQKELGINSKLISAKLKEFMDLDLLKKEGDKYSLSKFGKKLMKNLKPITKAISKFTEEGMKMLKKENKKIKDKVSKGSSMNFVII